MIPRRPIPKAPGGPPLSDKRDLYIQLMAKGMSNSAACKMIGINRRTGTRWRRGRTILNRAGQARIYAPIVRSRPADSGRQLSEAERVLIADGLLAGRSLRAIAAELGRSPSTVSREVARNRDHSGRYHPFRAHAQAASRRARPKPAKLAQSSELRAFVEDRLRRRWSPEQISSALVVEFPDREDMRVACETIYQAIYVPARGNLTRELARNLRTGRLRRRPQRRADRRTRRCQRSSGTPV